MDLVIDFHSHILPGIDDGSRSAEMSEAMLSESESQGVGLIVATPHFYADKMSAERFLIRREEAVQALQKLQILQKQKLQIITGAEVYYFKGMSKASILEQLCIDKTNMILIEMPFCQWTEEMYRELSDILSKRQLQIILAHVERYPEFQKDRSVWEKVMRLPLHIQINAGSFIPKGLFRNKKSKFCMDLVKTRGQVLLGSDCHNMDSRKPNLAQGREAIARTLSDEALRTIDRYANTFLSAQMGESN